MFVQVVFRSVDGSDEVTVYDSGKKEIQPFGDKAVVEGTFK